MLANGHDVAIKSDDFDFFEKACAFENDSTFLFDSGLEWIHFFMAKGAKKWSNACFVRICVSTIRKLGSSPE